MRTRLRNDDLISIGIDHEVSIVCDHDDLTMRLGLDEDRDQFVEDRFRVETLFWLIDDQRPVVSIVESEIEEKKNDATRSRRQLADVHSFVVDAVANRDMICAEEPLGEAFQPGTVFGLI